MLLDLKAHILLDNNLALRDTHKGHLKVVHMEALKEAHMDLLDLEEIIVDYSPRQLCCS